MTHGFILLIICVLLAILKCFKRDHGESFDSDLLPLSSIIETANIVSKKFLPEKLRPNYVVAYDEFFQWRVLNKPNCGQEMYF